MSEAPPHLPAADDGVAQARRARWAVTAAFATIGALLGAQPRVQLEAARMKDGAILLERVDATGQALALNGSGSRNLLGGLSFRGRAEITDVSRIRPGARGAFGAAGLVVVRIASR